MKTKAHTIYKTSDGKRVPGATTVIGGNLGWNTQTLIAWARREALAGNDPEKVKQQAADVGTICHALVENHIKECMGVETDFDFDDYSKNDLDQAKVGFQAFLDWEQQVEPEYCHSELALVSDSHQFGGTADIVARIDDHMSLLDIKTSSGVYAEHKIQCSAYERLCNEHGMGVDRVYILHLNKQDGTFTPHPISQTVIEDGWEAFVSLLKLHQLKKKFK